MKRTIAAIAFAFLAVSCASTSSNVSKSRNVWESKPPIQEAVNKQFSISLEPRREGVPYFNVFRITVQNQSNADMDIDWNKSRYIHNGREVSRLAFQGVDPAALRDGTIPPDVVRAGSSFQKDIAPVQLIAFKPLRDTSPTDRSPGIRAGVIPAGENGVLLVMRQNGREIPQQVSLLITEGSPSGGDTRAGAGQPRVGR